MEAKGNIRKEVFARRRAATQEEIQEKSRMIYERFLAAHPGFTTVAAAFEFQLFDAVPFEETDILPQMLVTEQKIYR